MIRHLLHLPLLKTIQYHRTRLRTKSGNRHDVEQIVMTSQ